MLRASPPRVSFSLWSTFDGRFLLPIFLFPSSLPLSIHSLKHDSVPVLCQLCPGAVLSLQSRQTLPDLEIWKNVQGGNLHHPFPPPDANDCSVGACLFLLFPMVVSIPTVHLSPWVSCPLSLSGGAHP